MNGPKPDSPRSRSKRIAPPPVVGSVVLPRAGRPGPPPKWPLETRQPTPAQLAKWKRLWATPQALMWERGYAPLDVVARYVITAIRADRDGEAVDQTAAARLESALGLNPQGMAALRWSVEAPEADAEVTPILSIARPVRRYVPED